MPLNNVLDSPLTKRRKTSSHQANTALNPMEMAWIGQTLEHTAFIGSTKKLFMGSVLYQMNTKEQQALSFVPSRHKESVFMEPLWGQQLPSKRNKLHFM